MKLIFFDEVKPEQNYPHYHIGAICIDETDLHYIENMVSDLSQESFESREVSKETEFHAAEIFHRKKNFKHWNVFEKRLEVIDRLLQILTLKEVALIDIQVNCDHLLGGQSPDEIAFMFLCERANDFVKAQKTVGMLIGDRENDRMSERYATTLSGYRTRGTDFAYGRDLNNLVDSVHFSHSHLSRFLQLADVYAWILQFTLRNRGSTNHRHQAVFELLKRDEINLFPAKYKEWPKD